MTIVLRPGQAVPEVAGKALIVMDDVVPVWSPGEAGPYQYHIAGLAEFLAVRRDLAVGIMWPVPRRSRWADACSAALESTDGGLIVETSPRHFTAWHGYLRRMCPTAKRFDAPPPGWDVAIADWWLSMHRQRRFRAA